MKWLITMVLAFVCILSLPFVWMIEFMLEDVSSANDLVKNVVKNIKGDLS